MNSTKALVGRLGFMAGAFALILALAPEGRAAEGDL